jgi:hypothetical protein
MAITTKPRLLLKFAGTPGAALAAAGPVELGLRDVGFKLEPLFQNVPTQQAALGVEAPSQWFLAETDVETDEVNPWDVAYRAISRGLGVAGAPEPELVEPDLLQSWPYTNDTPLMTEEQALAAAEGELCQFNPQSGKVPKGPGFAWFLRDDFSQLKSARDEVGEGKRRIRIAHFDTGYDPDHVTVPKHLNKVLQRNFVDADRPDDAADRGVRGKLRNPGHGPATLALLAGNVLQGMSQPDQNTNDFLGGAPRAEIVPVRVANSVVLFFTSAIAKAFDYILAPKGNPRNRCDVVSMSMGGAASRAWTDAVNAAYEAGIVIVTAAGNNFNGLPTRNIVYPALYHRVIAACGVMADGRAYSHLNGIMEGNHGPNSKMRTALTAWTPNMPWAELGCARLIDMDGAGTSSATPQIAAAAALWLQKHDPAYDEPWKRVEAVRRALFSTAQKHNVKNFFEFYGNGWLKAKDALGVAPAKSADLKKTRRDTAELPILRVLLGLGVEGTVPAEQQMAELEALQLLQKSKTLEDILPDPGLDPTQMAPKEVQRFFEALVEEPGVSETLKDVVGRRLSVEKPKVAVPALPPPETGPAPEEAPRQRTFTTPPPAFRRLRIYAFDPSLGTQLDTAMINQTTVKIPWERNGDGESLLSPGPVGEYLEVVDHDPASHCFYAPVDLNDPHLLAQDGLAPSEGNPKFHQQMVYAVAMNTIQHFERALGRKALWSPRHKVGDKFVDAFVRRLRIYPHALREKNAFYSPDRKALLFGYFPASLSDPGRNLPGGMVFTCLSHDIVAHETTHALLDGMHRRFAESSNRDVLAFHEAFADIVALFQHFTFPEALKHQIARTRGDLGRQNLLGELAQQFGQAIGRYGALRDAIGTIDPETKKWKPAEPDPAAYQTADEAHTRGAILVAAVFDAFLAIYKSRIADLLRIATSGTGVLPEGELHPDLVNRLANEASKTAGHILNMCIRALDYCPPVDITFGEYLRAVVTADADLVPDDDLGYRVAMIEAFRRRGIYPRDVRTLSADSLRWQEPTLELDGLDKMLKRLNLTWDLDVDRHEAFKLSERNRWLLRDWLVEGGVDPADEVQMGLALGQKGLDLGIEASEADGPAKGKPKVEVHSVRPLRRVGPDGQLLTNLVVEITQKRKAQLDDDNPGLGSLTFRGGCTLLIDLRTSRVRYCISKNISSKERLERQRQFRLFPSELSLYATYFGALGDDQKFAALHRGF